MPAYRLFPNMRAILRVRAPAQGASSHDGFLGRRVFAARDDAAVADEAGDVVAPLHALSGAGGEPAAARPVACFAMSRDDLELVRRVYESWTHGWDAAEALEVAGSEQDG